MSGFDDALASALGDPGPDTIALMRLLGEASSEAQARAALEAAVAASDVIAATRAGRLLALWHAHPDAWPIVRGTLGGIAHRQPDGDPDATLAYWAETFDRLVAATPEASVALYSLGSPTLLAAATDEVVDALARWGLLGPDRDVLDLGCGIGRFVLALAPCVRHVTGLDASAGMVAEAQRRCAGLPNVKLAQTDGRDLAGVPDRSLDLLLAADVFPYLVEAGEAVAAIHVAEAARVLRPGGALLILNYSYRRDRDRDSADLRRLAAGRFIVERDDATAFSLWDAAAFLLRRHA